MSEEKDRNGSKDSSKYIILNSFHFCFTYLKLKLNLKEYKT
jgi:hypothetical protein